MKKQSIFSIYNNERGASAIWVALMMFIFLGLGAFALDFSHIFVAKNELQNAADAGALAGTRFLYNDDGTAVNPNANQIGHDAAEVNKSEKIAVEVDWTSGNVGDVQRGHWSFGLGALPRGFIANDSLEPTELWGVSDAELDENEDFINAVRVITRREATPIIALFAGIFGFENFKQTATAVAYIGFAADIEVAELDQPIAICEDSILDPDGAYNCNIGRMINSGPDIETNETGGWTSFNQESNTGDDPCSGGTNAPEIRGLVCGNEEEYTIHFGENMATIGGEVQSAFSDLIDCWNSYIEIYGWEPWRLRLPVISCPENNVGTCETVLGYVDLNVVWITGSGEDPGYNNAPYQMGHWKFSEHESDHNLDGVIDGRDRWKSFVSDSDGFNLQNVDGSSAPYAKKSIYFLPDCTYHKPDGTTGGENFGILARIPVLVK